jgi:hypothetical protein
VIITCWSVKGGSGTTVVSAALGLLLARRGPTLLVDLAGDLPAALGAPSAPEPIDMAGPFELRNREHLVNPTLGLVSAGPRVSSEELLGALRNEGRTVVIDAGVATSGTALDLAATSTASFLVLRPCYLALRRAAAAPTRPSGVILISEPGRALRPADIEHVIGVPVRAVIETDAAVARAVDAGLMSCRLPRPLAHSLRNVA